jgi:dipeptidyl-peptidase 4
LVLLDILARISETKRTTRGVISMRIATGTVTTLCLFALLLPAGRVLSADQSLLTVQRIFDNHEFDARQGSHTVWLKDSTSYTVLEPSDKHAGYQDVVRYHVESGRRTVVVPAASLIPAGQFSPLRIESYAWSDDSSKLLIFNNSSRVWRQNTRGDYWVFDRDTRRLQKLGGDAPPSTIMFAAFSPDGGRVAYVGRNNLFVQNLDDLKITPLTTDGSETIVNGTSDWVNEEEFDLRNGFRWSPDGKCIAYWNFDTTGVDRFHLVNNTDTLYPKIKSFPYPKAGQTNSACRVGIVASTGGPTRWLKTDADLRNHYIPEMEWSPDSEFVVLQQLNRLQNTNQVLRGDVATGETKTIFTDRDDAWVDVVKHWRWIAKGKRLLWLSERDGWRHVYAVSNSGNKVSLLTPGPFDVIDIAGVDEQRQCLYVIASPQEPTRQYLYRVPLDGRGKLARVTPADPPGSHSYSLAPGCSWAIHTRSRFDCPPSVELVSLPQHKAIRSLTDNSGLATKLKQTKTCPTEFFRVDIGGGVQLDAWCIKPPDFNPAKRYPLLIHVYGEPAGQTVVDQWQGHLYVWHCMLAQQGYLVMSIENRGTAAPRGRQWRKCIYRQIGILASADQAAATRKILQERPYVDPKRIGIWGWSGGGSMSLNAIFRYPDLYRTAMAVASVSDERLYDTIYQERYMGLPADNKAGYEKGSPITFAHQLKGNLLLVHGTGDDNCHYQGCELLINELVKHNKQFSMMAYPNRSHGIYEGPNTQPHLFETLTRYLKENLPPGPAK